MLYLLDYCSGSAETSAQLQRSDVWQVFLQTNLLRVAVAVGSPHATRSS